MKRIIILSTLFFVCANIFAQHISFMGIPLGQSKAVFHNMLQKKGILSCGDNRYYGTFWKFENSDFVVKVKDGKVTSIRVNMDFKEYNKMSDFNNLVRNLNSKYGNYYTEKKENHGVYKTLELYWKVTGGYIVASYMLIDNVFLGVSYIDYSDSSFIPPKNKRNSDDDL